MKMPQTPFTMAEFVELNGLGILGHNHYAAIRKRFEELGLTQVRRRRDKTYAEQVWVRKGEGHDIDDLVQRLKQLTV